MNRATHKILDHKGLPWNKLAEEMILGGLVSGQVFPVAVEAVLSVEDFFLEAHRGIFRACVELSAKGEDVNRVSVAEYLESQGALASVGGLAYLIDLEQNPYPADLESFCNSVKESSIRRKVIHASELMAERAATDRESAATLDWAEDMLAKIGDGARPRVNLQSPAQIKLNAPGGINGFFYPAREKQGVPSPWQRLNELTGNFLPRQLVIIGAYTGVGKSSAAVQIAEYAARCGMGTTMFSFEMSTQEHLTRIICQRASINSHTWGNGYASREEERRFQKTSAEIDDLPLWIDDTSGSTVLAVQAGVRRQQAVQGVKLVIVDYLQLLESLNRHENRVQQITEITRGLKRLAREQNVAVIALSQLNRASQDGNPPSLKHLRESGSIEQDADKVILLHQPKNDNEEGIQSMAIDTEFRVEKNRGGPCGKITLLFQRCFTRFDDLGVNA